MFGYVKVTYYLRASVNEPSAVNVFIYYVFLGLD